MLTATKDTTSANFCDFLAISTKMFYLENFKAIK